MAIPFYGLALGYEDLNDHDTLRTDWAIQTAVESDKALASSPTLCRMENRADQETARDLSVLIVEKFIASFKEAPKRLVLAPKELKTMVEDEIKRTYMI